MSLAPQRLCKPRLLIYSKSLLGLTALVLGLSFCLSATHALAQDKTEDKSEKKGDEDEIPPPEEIDLTTDDGLEMKATYFPGTKGHESIPVIILHGFNKGKGSGKDFTGRQGLAPYLQETLGCAVIVPDLRGYGESLKIKINGNRTDDLKAKKVQPRNFAAKMTLDLRAVKDFLWKKNNQKALNLCKLAVVGVEEGDCRGAGLHLR